MPYDVSELRKRIQEQSGGRQVDPDEFKPKKAESTTDPLTYRFFVLPFFMSGEPIKGGPAKKSMTNFYIQHGTHWLMNKPYGCPRIWDGTRCEVCNIGFDLLREEKNEDKRKKILSDWMPSTYYAVNAFFPRIDINPEELRGRVKFFNAPKTCFDTWQTALMRENMGREDDPKAFGAFFDENAAFLFQLEVVKFGKNNSYKTSKFIVPPGGKAVPIVVGEDGKAHTEAISKLLAARCDLWAKVRTPDPVEIQRVAKLILEGDDSHQSGSGQQNFDKDETPVTPPPVTESRKPTAPAPDVLSNEVPFVESTKPKSEPKSEPVAAGSGTSNDEIAALLEQLGED